MCVDDEVVQATTIEDAASQDPRPAPWSDLSAAYLAKAERSPQRRIEYLARALEAVAVRDSKNSEGSVLIFPAARWTTFLRGRR